MVFRLLFFGLLYLGAIVGFVALFRYLKKSSFKAFERRWHGRENLEELDARLKEKCDVCTKPVNPAVDCYGDGLWIHRECVERRLTPEGRRK